MVVATITTYSMVALANPNKVVGEIMFSNSAASVNVNGAAVKSGNSIFSTSNIVTPENTDAVINFGQLGKVKLDAQSTAELSFDSENLTSTLVNGKLVVMSSANDVNTIVNIGNAGKLKLAPNTSIAVAFDGDLIAAELLAGEVVALSAAKTINVKTVNGKVSKLNTGETAKAVQDDDDDDDDNGASGLEKAGFAILFGGAAALILYALLRDDDEITLGGGTTVVSPTR